MIYIATFHTHFGAMSLARSLKKKGVDAKMMPVPRVLSASCGVCVRFAYEADPKEIKMEDMEAIYTETENGYNLFHKGE